MTQVHITTLDETGGNKGSDGMCEGNEVTR